MTTTCWPECLSVCGEQRTPSIPAARPASAIRDDQRDERDNDTDVADVRDDPADATAFATSAGQGQYKRSRIGDSSAAL
jgi:hypothetical protein